VVRSVRPEIEGFWVRFPIATGHLAGTTGHCEMTGGASWVSVGFAGVVCGGV
jgi:hypothetical protein